MRKSRVVGREPIRRAAATMVALALSVASVACSDDTANDAPAGDESAPAGETTTLEPSGDLELAPLDEAALAELTRYAEETGSTCVLVQRDGAIVHEASFGGRAPDDDQEIYSATKSVTSTLVGIAQYQGHLDIREPASTYVNEWAETDSEDVTIRDLLANVSGRWYDAVTDYRGMAVEARDKTAFAIELEQQHPPGEVWEYNNSAIQTLEAVLERATGEDLEEYAEKHLFGPLGMSSSIVRDGAGNPLTFMGVQASCRDLAHFGQLALQGGGWEGELLVDRGWFEEATSPATELNQAYGYLWWLNRPGRVVLPVVGEIDRPLWPAAREDAFAAAGLGGQIVAVYPSERTVVVRLATGQGGVQGQGNFVNEAARILFDGTDSAG
jgi:CubicO group peptidase (beta-lactamase class C family)